MESGTAVLISHIVAAAAAAAGANRELLKGERNLLSGEETVEDPVKMPSVSAGIYYTKKGAATWIRIYRDFITSISCVSSCILPCRFYSGYTSRSSEISARTSSRYFFAR